MLGNAFYAATKAEVAILTKRITMELGSIGNTMNAVAPGVVPTEMARDWLPQERYDAATRISEWVLIGRFGEQKDITNAVAFFAALGSGWVTGQVLAINGVAWFCYSESAPPDRCSPAPHFQGQGWDTRTAGHFRK